MFVFIVGPSLLASHGSKLQSFQVFEGGDLTKIQDLAKNSDDPFYALEYYYDGKLTTSRY